MSDGRGKVALLAVSMVAILFIGAVLAFPTSTQEMINFVTGIGTEAPNTDGHGISDDSIQETTDSNDPDPTAQMPQGVLPDISLSSDSGEPVERPPHLPITRTLSYYVYTVPSYYPAEKMEDALSDALHAWTDINPRLEFQRVYDTPFGQAFAITWQKNPILIQGSENILVSGQRMPLSPTTDNILIGIGITDCNGKYHAMDQAALTRTIAHEVGHVMGLGHHINKSHLMHGDARPEPDIDFDESGLTIPALERGYYGPYSTLKSEYDALEVKRIELLLEYRELSGDLDSLRLALNMTDGGEYNRLVHEYNYVVSRMDSKEFPMKWLISDMNGLRQEMDCIYSNYSS